MALTPILLDPASIAEDRVELDLNAGPVLLRQDGPDWGEGTIDRQMAQGQFGAVPLDGGDRPNRVVTIPLQLGMDSTDPTFGYLPAKRAIQKKVALFQAEGGWVQRDVDGLYGDVVGASLKTADRYSHLNTNEADLVLEVLPDWYGDEVALDPIVSTGPELIGVLKQGGVPAVIDGDYPARCRIEVDDDSGFDQLGLLFGLRCRHYSPDATAALAYAAQSLTPLDTAANATVASTACVRHTNLSTSWTPVLGTNLTAGTFLTHTGSYRVWARVYSTSTDAAGLVATRLRLIWAVGDFAVPVENAPVVLSSGSAFHLVDLGEVRLDRLTGVHQWLGQIQAKGDAGGENLSVARIELVPVDEAAGVLRGSYVSRLGQVAFAARDNFATLTTGVALHGRVAPLGGTWATSAGGGGGSTTDFAGDGGMVKRSTVNDGLSAGGAVGRLALLSPVYGETEVGGDFMATSFETINPAIIARYVDNNNFLRLWKIRYGTNHLMCLWVRLAGVEQILQTLTVTALPNIWLTLALQANVGGQVTASVFLRGSQTPIYTLAGSHPALAAGGALATGKAGFQDSNGATASDRYFDNAYSLGVADVLNVSQNSVLNAGRSAELSTESMFREDSAGIASGRVSHTTGDLPRLPPSGLEERPVELFLKNSRGDLDQLPDSSASDGLTARVFYRPTHLAP